MKNTKSAINGTCTEGIFANYITSVVFSTLTVIPRSISFFSKINIFLKAVRNIKIHFVLIIDKIIFC